MATEQNIYKVGVTIELLAQPTKNNRRDFLNIAKGMIMPLFHANKGGEKSKHYYYLLFDNEKLNIFWMVN